MVLKNLMVCITIRRAKQKERKENKKKLIKKWKFSREVPEIKFLIIKGVVYWEKLLGLKI